MVSLVGGVLNSSKNVLPFQSGEIRQNLVK